MKGIIHAGFSHIYPHSPDIAEVMSEPLLFPGEFRGINDLGEMKPLIEGEPALIGVTCTDRIGEDFSFLGMDRYTRTPLNDATYFIEGYKRIVGPKHRPMLGRAADSPLEVTIIEGMQDILITTVRKAKLQAVAGFLLQKTLEGPVCQLFAHEQALQVLTRGLNLGLEDAMETLSKEGRVNDVNEKEILMAKKDALVTLMLCGVARLLPHPTEVKRGLVNTHPQLADHFNKKSKAQQRALKAERGTALNEKSRIANAPFN